MISKQEINKELIEKVEQNIRNFRQGDPYRIDMESVRQHADKLTDIVFQLEYNMGTEKYNQHYQELLTSFKQHITELDKFSVSEKYPADARFIDQSAFMAILIKFGERLAALKQRVITA